MSGPLDRRRRERENIAEQRGHAFPGVGGRALVDVALLSAVDPGFEVDVCYARAVKASRR
jgi:hypothetical protein